MPENIERTGIGQRNTSGGYGFQIRDEPKSADVDPRATGDERVRRFGAALGAVQIVAHLHAFW